ncbi:MAG: hypothetical protein ACI8T1_003346 [Verrucomicrobiales bacterium]|jgi:hypothetical protein
MNHSKTVFSRMQILLVAFSLVLLRPSLAGLITVDLTAGIDQRFFADSGGLGLVDGEQVRIGLFTDGFDIAANASNLTTLGLNFTLFGSGLVKTIGSEAGRFGDSDGLQAQDDDFFGKQIYIWAFNTADNVAPDVSFSNVLGHGIFTSTNANWIYPQSGNSPPTTLISTSDSLITALLGTVSGTSMTGSLRTAAIPEPSSLILSLIPLAALWMASRRRSHRGRIPHQRFDAS